MNILDLRANVLWEKYHPHVGTLHNALNLSSFVPIVTAFVLLGLFAYLIRLIARIRKTLKESLVLLELTPPATTEKTAYTTQNFFSVIHTAGRQRSFLDRFLDKKTTFSFEIASTQTQGIRYFIRTTPSQVNILKHHVLSYLPQVNVRIVNDYLPENNKKLGNYSSKVIELTQSKHFAYPLQKQDTLYEHDPVAYITGMMTKLSPGELISFQLIITPTETKQTNIIKRMIFRGEDVLKHLDRVILPSYLNVLSSFIQLIMFLLNSAFNAAGWVLNTVINDLADARSSQMQARARYQMQYQMNMMQQNNLRPARVLTPFEQKAIESVEEKINQNLFQSRIRLLMIVKDKSELKEREQGFLSSLAVFSGESNQSLKKKFNLNIKLVNNYLLINFKRRLLSGVFNSSPTLLSISEISDLYHFPFTRVTQTENIVKVHSKELPAPLSLKQTTELDVMVGKNTYGGTTTLIGLTKEERLRHMYVIGATGTGKSTLLLTMINQDLKNGKGVCIVDPHGDLAEAAIKSIPEERTADLIYFNPMDIKYPIGVNLLELTPGLDEDESLIEKEFIAESVISLFRKVFSDAWSSHPHRIEYILRNTIHTAFTLENPTLFTIFELLNNPQFQKKAIQGLKDENLMNFWKYEFGRAGDYQKVKMVAPVTARIGRFLFSPSAKRILEQEKSTINFDEILDGKKILICNLSKGQIGEDTSEVMGIMILNKIQLASLKRARVEQKKREGFYLYVDEFQNFATPSFVQMLSEARKYGLNLVMAEQSTSQQKDRSIVNIILANAGTVISFRSANPQDEVLLLPQYMPYIDQGEIANLPSFHFYMKKAAIRPEEPFSGETMPIEIKEDKEKLQQLINSSRKLYATVYKPKQENIQTKTKISNTEATGENAKKPSNISSGLPDDD